jgi:hypothetical protein
MTSITQNVLIMDGPDTITGRGAIVPTPACGGPVEYLDRLDTRFGGDGLVLVTGRGLPLLTELTEHPGPVFEAGWAVTRGEVWRTARRGGRHVRFGYLPEINRDSDPLVDGNLVVTAMLHQMFHDLVGVPFYGDGGTTAALLMDATVSVRGRDLLRKWQHADAPQVRESPWCGPWDTGVPGTVTVDRNAQYLGAAREAILPLDALERRDGDPGGGVGLYRIEIPPNPEPRLPHPCGPKAAPGAWEWVATPTVELLAELGVTPRVAASWTCPAGRARRVLSGAGERGTGKWYERLRDARKALVNDPAPDAAAVLRAVKDTYSRGVGHLARPTGRWYRPDWAAIIQARARVDMWRAMHRAGTGEDRWPVSTKTDAVSYIVLPESLRLGTGIGEWKVA